MLKSFAGGVLVVFVMLVRAAMAQGDQDTLAQLHAIEPYRIDKEIKGKVQIVGSGSMVALGSILAENMRRFHPGFDISLTSGGSENGLRQLPSLPGGMAAVTRPVETEDMNALKASGVKQPVAILIGLDALAVFVHKDNPIKQLSPADLLKLFSDSSIKTWGQMGQTGDWANRKITIQGRGPDSGTHTFIERYLLQGGKIRDDAVVQETNADMLATITKDPGSISVAPLYLKTADTKALPIQFGTQLIEPTEATILRGGYPLVRPLMLVFDKAGPAAAVELNRQFLRFVLSREGQLDAVKAGYYPLNQSLIRQQQDVLGIESFR